MIFEKLEKANDRYKEIEQMITLPSVISNGKLYTDLMREYSSLSEIVEKYREFRATEKEMNDADEMMRDSTLDSEFRSIAEDEFKLCRERCDLLEGELKILLMPKDPNDSKNVIVEIRAGAGGEEAALFASDLYRMYCMYADARKFKVEIVTKE